MSIGEVLAELRAEFPDTTISKLRFLEAEGLVEPRRTAAGYRKYSWDDVARLRFVLSAQRDQYLPLRVIREQLASRDAAPLRLVSVGTAPEGDSRLSREQLVERSGLDEVTLAEVERLGLLAPIAPGRYDADALAVATAVAGLAAFGLEPRHLRAYRAAADREVGLFAQLVAPLARQNDPAARARAGQTADDLVRLSQQLHAALVRAGLREALGR
ncbi:MerR family transcriptional regulator [Phytohabitans sp. ZYX-F-186]|uniref:MerR family transcriptional regulator n=1 Tax=Phytohabitans maris TaxID=3071409 RepID=A0ABU0ZNL8_9ACTN|nr:MerR family transcriptional regulator [Phytohabitans sp. ZYX-F-186]MDQ7908605.1 MerR family transcriptional regulator [Phytohabitans sp. ZYX-F-186]